MNTFTQYSQANNEALEVLTGLHGDRSAADVHIAKQELKTICDSHKEQLSPVFYAYLEATLTYRQDKHAEALEQYESLLGMIHRPEERVLYPYVCIYIGTIYNYEGQQLLSQHYFSLAEKKLETDDDKLLLFLNVNLSGAFLQSQDWERALYYAQRAMLIGEGSDNHITYAMAMMNNALSLTMLGRFEEAREYLDQCFLYCVTNRLSNSTAYCQLYLAIWHQQQNFSTEAGKCYSDAFKLIKNTHDSLLKHEFFEAYTQFLYEQNQYAALVSFIKKILATPIVAESYEIRIKLYRLLADAYHQLSDFKNESLSLRELQKLQEEEIGKQRANEAVYVEKVTQFSEKQSQGQQSVLIQNRLEALSECGQLVASTSSSVKQDEVLSVFSSIKKLLPATSFSLAYYDAQKNELDYRFLLEEGVFHEPFTVSCDRVSRLGVYCVKYRETIRLNSADQDEINRYLDPEFHQQNVWSVSDEGEAVHGLSVIYTPVIYQDELLAVISVQFNRINEYTEVHERIVEQLANYLAVAMSNNRQKKELENHNDYLELIYHTDHLTGLKNRHGFDQWIKQQYSHNRPPTVAFVLALDGLKRFNQRFSRETGDDALAECANLLKDSLPEGVQLFRYHSDQFLVIGRYENRSTALELATSLQSNLKGYFSLTYGLGDEVVLTSTVGIVDLATARDRLECEERIARLENKIYEVKKSKRDGVFEFKFE